MSHVISRELAVGSVASKSQLALARLLASSFREHHPAVPYFVLLTDGDATEVDLGVSDVEVLSIADVIRADPASLRFRYTEHELCYALAPALLRHLLGRGFASAAYLKQESWVTAPFGPVWEQLARTSILLMPHLLTPLPSASLGSAASARELNISQSGVYNAGFVGVRDSAQGRAFLDWWADRTLTHCLHDVVRGLHFEQRWLDLVPSYFSEVAWVRDPGFGVGHWNLPERRVTLVDGSYQVDGHPCRFVRFSGFEPSRPAAFTRHNERLQKATLGDAARLLEQYAKLLDREQRALGTPAPYVFNRFDNGTPLSPTVRAWYRELGPNAARFGNPFDAQRPNSFFAWQRRRSIELELRGSINRVSGGVRRRLKRWLRLEVAVPKRTREP